MRTLGLTYIPNSRVREFSRMPDADFPPSCSAFQARAQLRPTYQLPRGLAAGYEESQRIIPRQPQSGYRWNWRHEQKSFASCETYAFDESNPSLDDIVTNFLGNNKAPGWKFREHLELFLIFHRGTDIADVISHSRYLPFFFSFTHCIKSWFTQRWDFEKTQLIRPLQIPFRWRIYWARHA